MQHWNRSCCAFQPSTPLQPLLTLVRASPTSVADCVQLAEVFREAIRENCPSLIVVHNHPSGGPTPSPDDIAVTRDLIEADNLLEIELLDHIVIADGRRVSMKQQRLGFGSSTARLPAAPIMAAAEDDHSPRRSR